MGQGILFAFAIGTLGAALMGLGDETAWRVGLVLLGTTAALVAGTLLHVWRDRLHARWDARRTSFWLDRPGGGRRRVSYRYMLSLLPRDRQALLSQDKRLPTWLQEQWLAEVSEMNAMRVEATSPLRRLWVRFALPQRSLRRS